MGVSSDPLDWKENCRDCWDSGRQVCRSLQGEGKMYTSVAQCERGQQVLIGSRVETKLLILNSINYSNILGY